ncbi:Hypothetical predicted protein [Cloeon dipterum]|uniref:Ribosomal protein L1 n=1 Tax=Cloeon dipterum TaxID=197152 RepID=A0A8S1C4F7_9INSE|nr:Hypothetical predicted protein [Cloeon dipterum]
MAAPAGLLTKSLSAVLFGRTLLGSLLRPTYVEPCRGMAARKGTREKARKKKVKVEIQKVAFDPLSQREKKNKMVFKPKMVDDLWRFVPEDDVYAQRFFRKKSITFEQAVLQHRETHHPTMYNRPDSLLRLRVELDMHGEKKTRFVGKLVGLVDTPHPFDQEVKRTIVVFTNDTTNRNKVLEAGAHLVGGSELVKGIQSGDVTLRNADFVIAAPDMMAELAPLRGIFKTKFPHQRNGSITDDVLDATRKFMYGIEYEVEKDDREPEFGWLECSIGKLDMPVEQLKANMMALIQDLNSKSPPKKNEPLIWRLYLLCPPGFEKFKLDLFDILGIKERGVVKEEVEEKAAPKSEDDDEAVAARQ